MANAFSGGAFMRSPSRLLEVKLWVLWFFFEVKISNLKISTHVPFFSFF